LPSDNDFIKKKVKANFVLLGKKLGAKMKVVAAAISQLSQPEIRLLESEGKLTITADGENVEIERDEVEIQSEDVAGWMVASKNALSVALDVSVTPALENEGNARELVNRIQKIRKDLDLELTDRIEVEIQQESRLEAVFQEFNAYICSEILADEIRFVKGLTNGEETDLNGISLKINVLKKG
jgi:isoleucyl-tRNA synthetase